MELTDVIKFIDENKEDDAVKSYLDKYKVETEVSLDLIKSKSEQDAGVKAWLDSIKDSHANKSLETWKTNNLDKLIDEKYKQGLPKEEQENLAIKELQNKIASMEQEKNYERQTNIALKTAHEKGLPTELNKFFIGKDDEETLANFSILEQVYNQSLGSAEKSRLKNSSYAPPKSSQTKVFTIEDLNNSNATPEQRKKFFEEQRNKKK